METINKIQNFIIDNDIESAYEIIMQNENQYMNNSQYWNLRGMLCLKIQEYSGAISCYKTSIDIKNDYSDAYFNLAYTYKLIGEKIKSVLYGGIALRYTDDIDFINDIKNLYENEILSDKYNSILEEVKLNISLYSDDVDLIKYITNQFDNIDKLYIDDLSKKDVANNWGYIKDNYVMTSKEILELDKFVSDEKYKEFNIIVPYDINYIKVTRDIALRGVRQCFIILPYGDKLELIQIDYKTMEKIKNRDYERTVTLNKFNAADSNIHALIKYMPKKYKEKYEINLINGREVHDIENIVKVPLISSVTVSGFNTFTIYPKFTYNIDVGHGDVIFKACGLMDKKDKNFAFTPQEYESIDKVCTISNMAILIKSSFSAIPENKYQITGNPRTDTLILSAGKENLEQLLDRCLGNKKVVFNMPTFHVHENTGSINGSNELDDSIKIKDFDYVQFDEFLEENNMLCISKVHHAEERTIASKTKDRRLNNLIFISNENLEEKELDLYEILNCADVLITDYSSIYGDFLFMDKPSIFVNTDIDEYRTEKGIILEPYDFWTAGPKVKTQKQLEEELLNCIYKEDYYRQKRQEMRDLFFKYKDDKSSLRVWEFISDILNKK